MSHLHVSPNLLVSHQELARLDEFTQADGLEITRQLLTGQPGLFLPTGQEWLVSLDVPADQSLQVAAGFGLSLQGELLRQAGLRGLAIPLPNTWYLAWVNYALSSLEAGTVTIGTDGQLVGDADCRFQDVLRGLPGVPTLIRLVRADGQPALNGGLDHEIQDVLDDQHAVLSTAGLVAETGLRYQVVGAFQFGWEAAAADQLIYRYDSAQVFLLPEVPDPGATLPDGYDPATAFCLARVRRTSAGVDIEDKRAPLWQGASETTLASLGAGQAVHPFIAAELLRWPLAGTPRDYSLARVRFGLVASAWSLDPSARQITLTQASGGAYLSLGDCDAADFVGWYVSRGDKIAYDTPGVEPRWRITAASKPTPSSLRLTLAGIDPADLVETFRSLVLLPDAEQVHLQVVPAADFGAEFGRRYTQGHVALGYCELELPCAEAAVNYYVEYAFSTGKRRTPWRPLQLTAYYDETQSDDTGELLATATRSARLAALGLVQVLPAPDGYRSVLDRVDLGDVPGVENRAVTKAVIALPFLVGTNRSYQRIATNGTFTQDQYLDLRPTRSGGGNLKNGNQFTIELAGNLDVASYSLNLTTGYVNPATPGTVLYTFTARDVRAIADGGLWVTAVYDGTQWRYFVHRRTEFPIGFIAPIGRVGAYNPITKFDPATGLGFGEWDGWALADTRNDTEDCTERTLVGYNYQGDATAPQSSLGQRDAVTGGMVANYAAVGNEGGEDGHQLVTAELASHTHPVGIKITDGGNDLPWRAARQSSNNAAGEAITTLSAGGDKIHENRMKYRVVLFAQKIS